MPTAQGAAPQLQQQMTARRAMLRQFRKNTRRRFNIGSQTGPATLNGPGTPFAFSVPQVGMVRAIYLFFDTLWAYPSAPTAPTDTRTQRGPWGFVSRLQCITNLGSNNIWDCSGWNTLVNNITKDVRNHMTGLPPLQPATLTPPNQGAAIGYSSPAISPYIPQSNSQSATADVAFPNRWGLFQYPGNATDVATTTWRVCFVLRIDVSVNEGLNFTQGMINAQAPQIAITVQGTLGANTDMYGISGTVQPTWQSGTVTPYYEYYEIPSPLRQVPLPTGMLHLTLQDQLPFTTTGKIIYQIPRQGVLLRLQQETLVNSLLFGDGGAASAAVQNPSTVGIDTFELLLNNSDTIYSKPWWLQCELQRQEYGWLPLGMYQHEFLNAMGLTSRGDFRDAVDTEAVTTSQFNTYVNSGAALGGSGNQFNFTREILVPFNTQATGSPSLQ